MTPGYQGYQGYHSKIQMLEKNFGGKFFSRYSGGEKKKWGEKFFKRKCIYIFGNLVTTLFFPYFMALLRHFLGYQSLVTVGNNGNRFSC